MLILGTYKSIKTAPIAKPSSPKRLPAIASAINALCLAAPCRIDYHDSGEYQRSLPIKIATIVTINNPDNITTP